MKFKNKILISILLILFLTIGVASAAEDFTSANSNVATVDNSTFFNYFDESGYLKESVSQNTLIFKGEFSNLNVEYIEINSPITLKGEGAVLTNMGIHLAEGSSNSQINGFTINTNKTNGIWLSNTANNIISDCTVNVYKSGVFALAIVYSDYNVIDNCNIYEKGSSVVVLGGSNYNTISNSEISSGASNILYICEYSFADYKGDKSPGKENNFINNIVTGVSSVWCYDFQLMDDNNNVINNTIYGGGISVSVVGSNNLIEGNTIYATDGTGIGFGYGAHDNASFKARDNTIIATGENTAIEITKNNCVVENNIIKSENAPAVNVSSSNNIVRNNVINSKNNEDIIVTGENNIIENNSHTIITPENFKTFFNDDGTLKEEYKDSTLLFEGEFKNIANISLDKKVKIKGLNAVLVNVPIYVLACEVTVDNLVLNADNCSYVIYALNADNLNLINNEISFIGTSKDINIPIYIKDSSDIRLENNFITAYLPSGAVSYDPITWASTVNYAAISLINDKNAVISNNYMNINANDKIGDYDSLYGLYITSCNNLKVQNNEMYIIGKDYATYLYPIYIASSENFEINSNDITAVGEICAYGIEIDAPSIGKIIKNDINVTSKDLTYNIYANAYGVPLKVDIEDNKLSGESNSVYAIEVLSGNGTISNNIINPSGNFVIGIASSDSYLTIRNNEIRALGTDKGTPSTGDYYITSENAGIKVVLGEVDINNNKITTSGEYAVNLGSTSNQKVTYNSLIAKKLSGNQAVYSEGDNLIENNGPGTIIISNDIEMYYKDGTRYAITLLDLDNNPIINQKVIIGINGVDYEKTTDNKGQVSMGLNLVAGEYTVTVSFKGTAKYEPAEATNNIKIKSTISSVDIVKYFRNATQYSAKFLDKEGNPLVNTVVTFNINGVFYTKITDNEGIAKLNINLAPDKYIITAYNPVTGESKGYTVTVLPVLTGSDLNMRYKDGSKYECKLVDDTGNPLKDAEVIFNINGVFYHKITDNEGIARLNINLLPGEYIITAMYNYAAISNKIKIKD